MNEIIQQMPKTQTGVTCTHRRMRRSALCCKIAYMPCSTNTQIQHSVGSRLLLLYYFVVYSQTDIGKVVDGAHTAAHHCVLMRAIIKLNLSPQLCAAVVPHSSFSAHFRFVDFRH